METKVEFRVNKTPKYLMARTSLVSVTWDMGKTGDKGTLSSLLSIIMLTF
jgi:hypothetical protein